jgi:hypothetical protein
MDIIPTVDELVHKKESVGMACSLKVQVGTEEIVR